MKGITGFRLRRAKTAQTLSNRSVVALPAARFDQGAQDRVMAKIKAMGEGFYAMSESAFDDWIDSLPPEEFFEFMAVVIELEDGAKARACAA
ncbi:hypothetical protein A9R05_42285 (plasmid) [Burkholderia sp. KK1]|uniref:hypothetical protein n=1 Tax=Burkholderia sp. M701 TaxID=326454 RepID=UPI000979AF0C|nr:hypothetical protein [Burkholderia sp. M701]AQH05649.1 hypothetical protein A9R05_42285 [Burkholderia sp. KK1]